MHDPTDTANRSVGEKVLHLPLLSNGTSVIDSRRIAIDSSNNIYVAGSTTGNLGGYVNTGDADIFIVKYSSAGAQQWIRQTGTASYKHANGITIDSKNYVYITGNSKSEV